MQFRTAIDSHGRLVRRSGRSLADRLEGPLVAAAYWLAVGLPIGYLVLLLTGIDSHADLGVFLGLLAVHGIALIGGRNYEPSAGYSEPW